MQSSNTKDLGASKSSLFERCKESIDAGERQESLSILLCLSEVCQGETEFSILKTLKIRHRSRFEKKAEDWKQKGPEICGIYYSKNLAQRESSQGGKRPRVNASNQLYKPKVSIITVNRNCAVGLEKTIQSVINQKKNLEYEIEHIIIDGASTDHSVEIIKKYEDQIDYYLSEPDEGIYSAMNKGLNYAKGDIIAFLNSEDTYLSHATKVSVENLEQNGVDISYGAFVYIKEDGLAHIVDGPRPWDQSMIIMGIPGGHETLFVRKEVYNKVGGYQEDFRIVSDYDWMIRAYLAGCSARPIQSILLQMTMGGTSSDKTIEKRECLQLMTRYLGEKDTHRLEEMYSLKYYRNWKGYEKSHSTNLSLLRNAGDIKECEPLYSQALVKTINRSVENPLEWISSDTNIPKTGKIRICIAVTHLNSITGGAERIAIESANRLVDDGHAVTIICCHGIAGEPFYKVDKRIRFIDIANRPICDRLYEVGQGSWELVWKEINRLMNIEEVNDIQDWFVDRNEWKSKVYKGFFRLNHFDLIISHMPSTYPYIALALAAEPNPPRHIAALHNSPSYKFHSKLYSKSPDRVKRVWLSTLGLCDKISVLFHEFIDELPGKFHPKTFVLPNFIDSGFLCNSPSANTTRTKRKIVSIGRLVPQKNHKALIDAFSLIQDRISDWSLEIYGEGPLKGELEEYCAIKGFDPKRILLGRTDFPKSVYDTADIFVFPSHFEGFGLALVEAMACGLPVVGFEDCPGVKFIITTEINGLLVKKDEGAISLADAIFKLANDEQLRRELGLNAIISAKNYTLDRHIEKLEIQFNLLPKASTSKFRRHLPSGSSHNVAIVCTNPPEEAGIGALRLQGGLHKIGLSSCMFSSEEGSHRSCIKLTPTINEQELNSYDWRRVKRCKIRDSSDTFFPSEIRSVHKAELRAFMAYDVINLHGISHFLSFTAFSWLLESGKPIVWTLYDMTPFIAGCHPTSGCDCFAKDCECGPQVMDHYNDQPKRVLEKKMKLWQDRITIISPSVWLANEARKSKVFAGSRIEVIPNGLDTFEFQPCEKTRVREILGLPKDKKIVLFACHSHAERRKGFQEALMMLISLSRGRNDLHLVTVGSARGESDCLPVSNTAFGYVSSSLELSMIYSACDVTVLPSLEDNLPNIILESLSCGTPIAAFKTGGIIDLIEDGLTGYLAESCNFFDLGKAVEKCLNSDLTKSCRAFAVEHLDITLQAESYGELFNSLLSQKPC